MTGPSLIEVCGLGVVQGLTEFLPVSSSGHLAVGQMLLGLKEGNLTVSIMLHAGTLVATVLFFWPSLRRIVGDVTAGRSTQPYFERGGVREALTIVVASLPIAIVGLSMKDTVEQWTTNPLAVGAGFVLTALVLLSTRSAPLARLASPSLAQALVVGVAQAVAIAPGVSRSGMTIAALLWFGVNPVRSFELSMLVSFPAVAGAFLLEARHLSLDSGQLGTLAAGALVSLAVGLGALKLLRGVVTQGRLSWFALWVLPMAALTLLM